MLKEVLIVEGKMDTVAVKRALECDTIETGGFALRPDTLRQIQAAYEKRGIIILTDPDGSGERIRKYLTERFPNAGQAFVPKKDAKAPDDVGIEQAKPEAILAALAKVLCLTQKIYGITACPAGRMPATREIYWERNWESVTVQRKSFCAA